MTTALVNCPGHAAHGRRVRVVRIDPAFNLAHDQAAPLYAEIAFISWPGQREPVGIGRKRLMSWREGDDLPADKPELPLFG